MKSVELRVRKCDKKAICKAIKHYLHNDPETDLLQFVDCIGPKLMGVALARICRAYMETKRRERIESEKEFHEDMAAKLRERQQVAHS